MKYKKSLIFISLIIFLFSIASVCASDANQTAIASDEINQELNSYDADAISVSERDMNSDDLARISSEENDDSILRDNDENKTATHIVASDLSTNYTKDDHLEAILLDENNNPISGAVLVVNFNGGDKYVQSNANGKISASTRALDIGLYNVTITYGGNEKYAPSNTAVKITVNKIDSTLVSQDSIDLDYGETVNITAGISGATGITAKLDDMDVEIIGLKVVIPELDAGTHILYITTIPDEKHNPVTKTTTITVSKEESSFTLRDVTMDYGGSTTIKVSADWATDIIASIDGNNVSVNDRSILISGLDAGTHILSVKAIGDKNHDSVTKNATITINKVDSAIGINDITMYYGGSGNITVDSVGITDFTAKIDDESITVIGDVIVIPVLDAGKHSLTVTTIPDSNHKSVTKTATITVYKVTPQFSIRDVSYDYGSNYNMTVALDSSVKFIAQIDENDVDVSGNRIMFPKLDVGKHTVTVTTVGDKNYDSVSKTAKITVNKAKTNVTTVDLNGTAGLKMKLTAGMHSVETVNEGVISFYNGETKIGQTNVNGGTAQLQYTPQKAGVYTISVVYGGTSTFESSSSTFKLTVLGKTNSSNSNSTIIINSSDSNSSVNDSLVIVIPYLKGSSGEGPFEIKFPEDTKGNITLSVFGKDYVFDLVNGVADITMPELDNGNYSYTIKYSGDGKYNPFTTTGNLIINNDAGDGSSDAKPAPKITIPSLDEPSKDGSIEVKLPSDATGSVTLTVNNTDYKFNVVNGVASIDLPDLEDGSYSFIIRYSGDGKYSSYTKDGSFSVNKTAQKSDDSNTSENTPAVDNSKISASNVKVTYATGKYYTIKVYGADGKLADGVKVVISVNGKTFKTLTTKNGVAQFKVTNAPGTYKMTINAVGKSVTKTLTVKHLVSLKTVTVKKSAKKLVLQANLGKVNGKYLKNKKITFKFNGKKYTAKTSSKGVAKVTIKSSVLKKLKVGKKLTYQATYSKDTVKKTVKIKK